MKLSRRDLPRIAATAFSTAIAGPSLAYLKNRRALKSRLEQKASSEARRQELRTALYTKPKEWLVPSASVGAAVRTMHLLRDDSETSNPETLLSSAKLSRRGMVALMNFLGFVSTIGAGLSSLYFNDRGDIKDLLDDDSLAVATIASADVLAGATLPSSLFLSLYNIFANTQALDTVKMLKELKERGEISFCIDSHFDANSVSDFFDSKELKTRDFFYTRWKAWSDGPPLRARLRYIKESDDAKVTEPNFYELDGQGDVFRGLAAGSRSNIRFRIGDKIAIEFCEETCH